MGCCFSVPLNEHSSIYEIRRALDFADRDDKKLTAILKTPNVLETVKNNLNTSLGRNDAVFCLWRLSRCKQGMIDFFKDEELFKHLWESVLNETDQDTRKNIWITISNISYEKENASKMLYLVDELIIRSSIETDPECFKEFYKMLSRIAVIPSNQSKMASNKDVLDFLFKGAKNGNQYAHMALANIVGSDETLQHYLDDLGTGALSQIIDILYWVLDPNRPYKGGWELSRPLQSLRNMALNATLRDEMAPEVIPLLPKAFNVALNDEESMEYIISLYSRFAKNPHYKLQFQNDPIVRTQIETLRKFENLRTIADGLAFDLFPEEESKPAVVQPNEKSPSNKTQAMISYSWAQKSLATEFKRILESLGFEVWQDVDSMKGNIMQAMARAVDNSDVVFVFISRNYYESDNCCREATYAANKKKKIIPILAESNYKWSGWLEMLLGTLLYYDVTGGSLTREKVSKILSNEVKKQPVIESADLKNDTVPSTNDLVVRVSMSDSVFAPIPKSVDEVYEWCKSLDGDFESVAEVLKKENVDGKELSEIFESGIEGLGFMLNEIDKKTTTKFYSRLKKMFASKA